MSRFDVTLVPFELHVGDAARFAGVFRGWDGEVLLDTYLGQLLDVLIAQMTVITMPHSQGLLIDLRLLDIDIGSEGTHMDEDSL